MPRAKPKHKYDVALSFAGEDRSHAARIASRLKKHGVKVFYDRDNMARLWGKKQDEYERIYGPESRFVVPLVSSHYQLKDWCQLELDIARQEAKRRRSEFLLPVRLDDTRLLGIHGDLNFLDLRQVTVGDVVASLLHKLGRSGNERSTDAGPRCPSRKVAAILTHGQREALGIMACSPYHLGRRDYVALFPAIDWAAHLRCLLTKGLVAFSHKRLIVRPAVCRTLANDGPELRSFRDLWIGALEPVRQHPDCAALLGFFYAVQERFDEAVETLTGAAGSSEPTGWDSLLLSLLTTLSQTRVFKRLSHNSRLKLLNARGICLSRSGEHEAALVCFSRLRSLGRRYKEAWATGHFYVNTGVVYANKGDARRAARFYAKAVHDARERDDAALLSHALGNLATQVMDGNAVDAAAMLREALSISKRIGDWHATGSALLSLGNLAASNADYGTALAHYERVERLARKHEYTRLWCLALHNRGRAYADSRHEKQAVSYFRRARETALREGYHEMADMALDAEACTRMELRRYDIAERLFHSLANLRQHAHDDQGFVAAQHNEACAAIKRGRGSVGRRLLQRSLRTAVQIDDSEWTYQCQASHALSYVDQGNVRKAIRVFARLASQEYNNSNYVVAARLWLERAALAFEHGFRAEADDSFRKCRRAAELTRAGRPHLLELHKLMFSARWENRSHEEALSTLDLLAKEAKRQHQTAERFDALDQKGVCLQDLGRLREAEKCHRAAIKIARAANDQKRVMISLRNLAELLRRNEQFRTSVRLGLSAECIAETLGDKESEISIRHNRALALDQQGRGQEAERLLRSCVRDASRNRLWCAYARALHGLANISKAISRPKVARRRYATALRAARQHCAHEEILLVSLNYAHLLNGTGQHGDAKKLLAPLEEAFKGRSEAHLFYRTLAEAYEGTQMTASAKTAWLKAKSHAELQQDHHTVAMSAETLAMIHEEEGRLNLAEIELLDAIKNVEDNEDRASLMARHVAQLWRLGRDRDAERRFNEVRAIAKEHGFHRVYVDLHMTLGDHLWRKGKRSQLKALQAYFAAMPQALLIDLESFFSVGIHACLRLGEMNIGRRIRRIDQLTRALERWLYQQSGLRRRAAIIKKLLWPMRAAREAATAEQRGDTLSEHARARICQAAFGV